MDDQRPTEPAPPPELRSAVRLWLMEIADDGVKTHHLPHAGRLVIGRAAASEIRIDRDSISRRHAALTMGTELALEDLGGVNGTYVRGEKLAAGTSIALRIGEVFYLGTVAMVVQQAVELGDRVERGAVVDDVAMRAIHAQLALVAAGELPVLLLGETGVGKEVSADLLHALSPRRDRPLVKLNCGALTETLLESELFGHERGAFSGAAVAKTGLLEAAGDGTVFLDEVGELTPSTQVKLLRVIEERAVRRVGAVKTRAIAARFVSATNRDLEQQVARGTFRADLYYRLAGATITIPPLRERQDAIEPIATAIVETAARRIGRAPPAIAPETLALLRGYRWPGNIRELRNVVERGVLMASGQQILPEHLPAALTESSAAAAPPGAVPWWQPDAAAQERARIIAALEATNGHQGKAAEKLGISRRTLLNRLDALDIPRPRKNNG